jgi:hypothetical protein
LGGRRKAECPILAKFTSFWKKLKGLKNVRNLASSKVRVDEVFSKETRRITTSVRSGVTKLL